MQLVKVSYEQCRLEFFEEQLAAAQRKLDYAVKRNYPYDVCASRGEVVAFYEWAVEMAQQEVATDNNVGNKTNADKIRSMDDETLATQFTQVFQEGIIAITDIPVPTDLLNELRSHILDKLQQPTEVEW